jgi:hypothetical protein
MVAVPLGRDAYQRTFANEPEIHCLNRFFEENPTNLADGVALLARPGTVPLVSAVGDGLIRGFFTAPGLHDGDLFFVCGDTLYRYQPDGTLITIGGLVYGTGKVSMAFQTGAGYERLFLADGTLLQYYAGGSLATGTLTESGSITNQVFEIGGTFYTWSATLNVDSAGTSADPWRAKLGANDTESLANMVKLLHFDGVRGVDFSQNLGGPSSLVTAVSGASTMTVTSKSDSLSANDIATTVFSGAGLAWGDTTLNGAGTHVLQGIEMPDGLGAQSVASLASHVLVSVANSGRFYWIEPGDVTIDPLNFATAESQPDNIVDMLSVGDTVWMMGEGSTEAWYATGQAVAPFAPTQGRVYARGVVQGTAVRIKDQVILVGSDGVVYSIGGGVQRISHHGIEERIRTQLERELSA